MYVFFGLGAWAGCAPLEVPLLEAVRVEVSVAVQHLEDGMVFEILYPRRLCTEGRAVLQLDATQYNAQLRMVEGSFWAQRAALDRLVRARWPGYADFLHGLRLWKTNVHQPLWKKRRLFAARLADRRGGGCRQVRSLKSNCRYYFGC